MKIITIPNQQLRQTARNVEVFDKKVLDLIKDMSQTLSQTVSPRGVALAAPQVDKLYRVLITRLPTGASAKDKQNTVDPSAFINPVITKHSQKITTGANPKDPDFEGCLSMPKIWGPVPRWEWIELEYQTVDKTGKVSDHRDRFEAFFARVLQHEIDHFDGVLFTDYALQYDLPVYLENKKGELVEIEDYSLLESF
ncbi:MAG: peptide deformylase [Patescibacteria group bacterium]